jgi:CubicO group peptidase (beta-lactamase class C family)
VPGQDVIAIEPSDFQPEEIEQYRSVLAETAKPYRIDRRGRASVSQYPATTLDAASGLISTVRDLTRFTIALDSLTLLDSNTLAAAWAPPQRGAGTTFGLGWFVEMYEGQPVVWHFGYAPDASSALFIHLPARHKTLILLANSDGLAAAFSLPNGDLALSPFARLFLSLFG